MSETSTRRQRLIDECQGLVRFLAQRIHAHMPSWIELDDLISYGQIGLLQAAQEFDPDKGTKFSTFAYYRIRGEIYDGAHKLMWFRGVRERESKCDQLADTVLEAETAGGAGGTRDLPNEASWFRRVVSSLAVMHLASGDEEETTPELEDRKTPAPWTHLMGRETNVKLREAVDRLPADAAALLRAVYFEDRTLQEAGDRLGISKSWASRMHARALEQLARTLKQAGLSDSS